MKLDRQTISEVLGRSAHLLCPACGQASIVRRPFRIKRRCSSCEVVFTREEGFFVGAILVNVVSTEIVILVLYLLSLPIINAYYNLILISLFFVALTFPVAFYHHSWALWLGFDHLVESLEKREW